jgi:hypothetical protein
MVCNPNMECCRVAVAQPQGSWVMYSSNLSEKRTVTLGASHSTETSTETTSSVTNSIEAGVEHAGIHVSASRETVDFNSLANAVQETMERVQSEETEVAGTGAGVNVWQYVIEVELACKEGTYMNEQRYNCECDMMSDGQHPFEPGLGRSPDELTNGSSSVPGSGWHSGLDFYLCGTESLREGYAKWEPGSSCYNPNTSYCELPTQSHIQACQPEALTQKRSYGTKFFMATTVGGEPCCLPGKFKNTAEPHGECLAGTPRLCPASAREKCENADHPEDWSKDCKDYSMEQGIKALQLVPDASGSLDACQGNCSSDSDCNGEFVKCWDRGSSGQFVPGCFGSNVDNLTSVCYYDHEAHAEDKNKRWYEIWK